MSRSRPIIVAALLAAAVLVTAGAAAADPGSATRDGKTLTVSKADDLRVEGEKVRVRGSGYDRNKGIYVAFCVDNGPGKVPTPCGGGADTEGTSGNSVWISDLPPAYGTGLARPYSDGGTFDVEINVKAILRPDNPDTEANETVDCRTVRCGVVTRNDHTRSEDRSQDVVVPISFAMHAGAAPAQASPAAPAPTSDAPARSGADSTATAASPGRQNPPDATVPLPAAPAAEAASASSPPPSEAAPVAEGADESQPISDAGADAEPLAAAVTDPEDPTSPASGQAGLPLAPLLLAGAALAAGAGGALTWRRRHLREALHGA